MGLPCTYRVFRKVKKNMDKIWGSALKPRPPPHGDLKIMSIYKIKIIFDAKLKSLKPLRQKYC